MRVIAGTKRDLKQMVADGKFREDLFYRLNVLPIVLPPLRERREDIPVLMEHFLKRFRAATRRRVPDDLRRSCGRRSSRYRWPGNVRELENACERIAQTCTCGTVRVGCMAASMLFDAPTAQPRPRTSPPRRSEPASISLDDRLREVESNLIGWALKVSDGNKSRAAELLNIKRSTLGDRIARCGLEEHDEVSAAAVPVALAATA